MYKVWIDRYNREPEQRGRAGEGHTYTYDRHYSETYNWSNAYTYAKSDISTDTDCGAYQRSNAHACSYGDTHGCAHQRGNAHS